MVNIFFLYEIVKVTRVSLLNISKLNIQSLVELGNKQMAIFDTVEAYIRRVLTKHLTTPLGKYSKKVCDVRRTRQHTVKKRFITLLSKLRFNPYFVQYVT